MAHTILISFCLFLIMLHLNLVESGHSGAAFLITTSVIFGFFYYFYFYKASKK